MKLSILIPVYNEEKTLEKIVEKVQNLDLGKISKEILIINDASKDNTIEVIKTLRKKYSNIQSFTHEKNRGKGAAVKTGLAHFTGDFVVVQDGDLEYDPEDLKKMLPPLIEGKTKVVYGSRMIGKITGFNIPLHYYGNKLLALITYILYHKKLTDLEGCYKIIARDVIKNLNLKSDGFEIDIELTAKLIKKKQIIIEVPISYNCRTFEEGKKITWVDGLIAMYILFKHRFFS